MKGQVVFLPGWHYTPSEEDQQRFKDLQTELNIFRAEIDYQYGNLPEWQYTAEKEMAHLRIRQVIGIVSADRRG